MTTNPWPMVVLACVAIAAVTVLGLFHVDASVITNMLILFGIGSGLGLTMQLRSNVNGNQSKTLDVIASALEKLSRTPPISDAPKEGESDGGPTPS